jgi:hypothetical protein
MKTKKVVMVYKIISFLAGVVLFFPALALAYDLKEYYPLNQGNIWKYSFTDSQSSYKETARIVGEEIIGDVATQKMVYSDNEYGCLVLNSEGLRQYKYVDDSGYEIFSPPEIIFPNGIGVGEAKEYRINKIRYNLAGEKMGENKEVINISLEAMEDVEVPAGKFINCLKFSIMSKEKSMAGDYNDVNCSVWLAQGVGQVKTFCFETEYNAEAEKENISSEIQELISAVINGKNIGRR